VFLLFRLTDQEIIIFYSSLGRVSRTDYKNDDFLISQPHASLTALSGAAGPSRPGQLLSPRRKLSSKRTAVISISLALVFLPVWR